MVKNNNVWEYDSDSLPFEDKKKLEVYTLKSYCYGCGGFKGTERMVFPTDKEDYKKFYGPKEGEKNFLKKKDKTFAVQEIRGANKVILGIYPTLKTAQAKVKSRDLQKKENFEKESKIQEKNKNFGKTFFQKYISL
jgi:hypothetical protein